jgi:hypothetical protein
MEYFAGLDVSMSETHVCVVTQDGTVIDEVRVPSTPAGIVAALKQAPACRRVLFETGRMAPMLYHGLSQLGLPVVCVESRQAYQALKSLATHKTDRNDARGLAHLARTGFFKPVHVKSLPAHAVRSLIIARKKAGRPTGHSGEPDPRPCRGVRRPTATCTERGLHQAGASDERGHPRPVLRHAGSGCGTCRRARGRRGDRCGHKTDGQGIRGLPPAHEHSRYRPTHRTRLHRRSR